MRNLEVLMKKSILALTLTLVMLCALVSSAAAQEYSFNLNQEIVHVFWNSDGTLSLDYYFIFINDPGAHVIDFVDVGMPNSNYDFSSITADVDGNSLSISSDFQGDGPYGFSVDMGAYAIQPGNTGHVHVAVGRTTNMLYNDTNEPQTYASGEFSPAYWTTAHGTTDLTVVFHLPPDMQPGEPRYHNPNGGWPGNDAPQAAYDNQNRVTYSWHSAEANGYTQYTFGMSFPKQYVPASAIVQPSIWEQLGISADTLTSFAFFACCGLFFVGVPLLSVINGRRRKMQYLPPKISIEGHGIKRGLTSVEAAILMEQPLDKVMTMILFGVVKKDAASVITRDPLKLQVVQPLPEGLHEYEKDFLKAFSDPNNIPKKGLQEMTVNLVKSVGDKMKGFSRKESIVYYKSIMERAWQQIEAAGTPEVKSQMYEEALEWTMLDKDYDERTRRVFTGPIFIPMWWGRYDPTFRPVTTGAPKVGSITPAATGGRSSLPGAAFAASVVGGVQNFSSKIIGDVSAFTSGVTNRTNPIPKTSSSSSWKGGGGGGGRSCACACACAGCACACAGGGR
jgi:hypothetical protein